MKLIAFLITTLFFSDFANADYKLALNFYNKKQVKKSLIEFAKASKESDDEEIRSNAMYNIAVIHDFGLGIKMNKELAVAWYKSAASNDHKIAQYNLGWMFYNGESVSKDFLLSFEYYKQSAEQNYSKAQFNLANLFINGDGTMKDYVKAYKWYKLSLLNGEDKSKKFLKRLTYLMHPSEVSLANIEVQNWLKKHKSSLDIVSN